jgi:hypothetical protein
LEKKPSMILSQEPWVGVKVKVNRPIGYAAGHNVGLVRDMSRMVVEDDFDRGVGRVGRVEEFEELDELAAAVAFLDQSKDVTGEQIDAGPPPQEVSGVPGDCQEFRARRAVEHQSDHGGCEALAEQKSELGLGHGPLRGGMIHCFSERFNTRKGSFVAASSLGK